MSEWRMNRSPLPRIKLGGIDSADPNALTVVYTRDGSILTKRIRSDGSEKSYDRAYLFGSGAADVSTTEKVVALARDLALHTQSAIIYGALARGANPENHLRRQHPRRGEPATYIAVPRSVYPLDADGIMPLEGLDLRDLRAAAAYVRSQLPEPFRDVEIVAVAP
jgi:hypothetical protein